MRILDKYLLKTFFMPWLSCLVGFIFLFVIVDLVDHLNNFVDQNVPPHTIAVYYLRFIPSIWIYVGPITLLLGLLYSLNHLSRYNEIIAMRASGISLYRILLPFIVFGILISLISIPVSRTIAPRNMAWTGTFMNRLKHPGAEVLSQLRFKDPESLRIWDIDKLELDTHKLIGVTVNQRRPDDKSLEFVLKAEYAVWIDNYWFFHNVALQPYNRNNLRVGAVENWAVLPKQDITESPERIIRETKNIDFMTSDEMEKYLEERPAISDATLARLRTNIHMRWGQPWLCLVTMLLAVPLGTQTARKGSSMTVALCILLFFTLFFMMNFFKALGLGMIVPPWVAGWTPTLVFGALGLWLLRKIR